MFINRKNDGSVKMTSQRATSKPHLLGMTQDSGTLHRYLQTAGEKTPKQTAAERLHVLPQSEGIGTCTTFLQTARCTYKLCFFRRTYWWVKKEAHGTSKSLRYRGRDRAIRAFNNNRISWIDFFPASENVNDCALPWTSAHLTQAST